MKNVKQVEAWWAVRQYIQVDFKDESSIMDACGVIVFLLIWGFLFQRRGRVVPVWRSPFTRFLADQLLVIRSHFCDVSGL